MEEECDKYFNKIEYKAVKVHFIVRNSKSNCKYNILCCNDICVLQYFYQEYYIKTSDQLTEFDGKFEVSLRKEEQRQRQVKHASLSLWFSI